MWKECLPLLFLTRKECRAYIDSNYGYIRDRYDLKQPPHNWRMPKAVKVEVILKEVTRTGGLG